MRIFAHGPAPLQERSPAQLRDGLTIAATGGQGDTALPLARLMQDAAEWKAEQERTSPSLATVKLHDVWGDRFDEPGWRLLRHLPLIGDRFEPYQAYAEFHANKGHFQLADSQSKFLEAGITHLKQQPFAKWSEVDQADFVEANATILHELGHLTLKNYSPATIDEWNRDSTPMEEGLAELLSVEELPEFMRHEYGVKLDRFDEHLQTTASVYTPYTARMRRLFTLGGITGHKQVITAARLLSAAVTPAERESLLAESIAEEVAGKQAPRETVEALADAIPDYLDDAASGRTMDIVAELRDHASWWHRLTHRGV